MIAVVLIIVLGWSVQAAGAMRKVAGVAAAVVKAAVRKVEVVVTSTAKKRVAGKVKQVASTAGKAASAAAGAAGAAIMVAGRVIAGSVSDEVQTALDLVGLVSVIGELADGANAVIYAAKGDYANAALSAAVMLPIGGQAATGLKFGDMLNNPTGIKCNPVRDTVKVMQGKDFMVVSGTGPQHIVTVMVR